MTFLLAGASAPSLSLSTTPLMLPQITKIRRAALQLLVASVPLALMAQGTEPCPAPGACVTVSSFSAAVTDFRTSTVDRGTRLLTATVRITNRMAQPLILGYVTGSGVSIDDRGNRYVVYGSAAVRGIGEITSNNFDPKFALRPGESSDARFEFTFQPASRDQIIGTAYDLDLTFRQIDPLAGNQFRLGREHSLHFRGFGRAGPMAAGGVQTAPAPAMTPPPGVGQGAVPMEGDQCAGRPRCYGAGTFVAEVTSLSAGIEGRHHVLRSTIRIRNMSSQPVILGYKGSSSGATDNLGNRYYCCRPGTHDVSSAGIGLVEGAKADPQFLLAPGESREARFSIVRFDGARLEHGTSFSEDVSFVLLEPLPSGQIRVGREFAVSFRDLAPGGSAALPVSTAAAAQRLVDLLRGKKKP